MVHAAAPVAGTAPDVGMVLHLTVAHMRSGFDAVST